MMPRTEEQFEEIREERKQLIMDAALELFACEGYYPTSISSIAEKAGVSKGLMYNYFESKEALIKEIIFSGMEEMLGIFDPNKDGILTEDEFVFFINEAFRMLTENLKFWKLYFAVIVQPPVLKLIDKRIREISKPLEDVMIQYYKSHGVKDARTEAILFGSVVDGLAMNYIMNPDGFPVESAKEMTKNRFGYITKKSR